MSERSLSKACYLSESNQTRLKNLITKERFSHGPARLERARKNGGQSLCSGGRVFSLDRPH
jgi:hypothetical protein